LCPQDIQDFFSLAFNYSFYPSLFLATLFPISAELRRKVKSKNQKNLIFVVFVWPADRELKTTSTLTTVAGVTVNPHCL